MVTETRNIATCVGASEPRSSSVSLEVDQQFIVIKEASPTSKMRKVVVPSVKQSIQITQVETQSLNQPLVPSTQERSIVERIAIKIVATAPERTEPERELALVTDLVPERTFIPDLGVTPLTTPMPNLASGTTFQEIPATPTTAKVLLLLNSGPIFDKIATQAKSNSTKLLARHTEKLPIEQPTTSNVIPNAVDI